MKIGEHVELSEDGKQLLTRETHDPNPYIKRVADMRELSDGGHAWKDMRHIGTIPGFLIEKWATEAGVSVQDEDAITEIILKKMASGEYDKLRVGTGKF